MNWDAELFATLDRLLDQALDQPEDERLAWVQRLPPEFDALRPRLLSLLSGASRQGSPLDRPPRLPPGQPPAAFTGEAELESQELPAGAPLGRYQVRGLLGRGGMGRVYRALDPVLGREVAIKVLPGALRSDPASLRQVEREARTLATVNHPNVAAIYGLERLDEAPCLVLELVEGETLAERLWRGPLRLEAAVSVATQVAAALEEAHRRGIVHRDLKPANIKVSAEGRVKVLDFGIAKALGPPLPDADPVTHSVTQAGAAAPGTVPYMAPEQVRGEPVDTRADVWAFGCLLYEMLSGERAFAGSTGPEVMAAVLRDPIRWEKLPGATPPGLRRLLRRCLSRERSERLQAIGDARLELFDLDRGDPGERSRRLPARLGSWLLAAGALAAAGALLLGRRVALAPPGATRLSIELPAGLALAAGYAAPFDLSPDGTRVALVVLKDGSRHLALRTLGSLEVTLIPGTEGAWQPAFSPDGQELAFFADRKLRKVGVGGGPVLTLAEVGEVPRGASWGPDGQIVFAPSQVSGLSRVSASGGPVAIITRIDPARGESSHRWPQVLPGGRWVLFTVGLDGESFDEARLEVLSLATGERRLVMPGGTQGRYAQGHLLFAREGRLHAVPFDASTARARGSPAVLVEGVRYSASNGGTHYAVSGKGQLLYGPGAERPAEGYLAWVDGTGQLTRLPGPPRLFREPRLSPDGRRVAVVVGPAAQADLWLVEVDGGAETRVTFGLSPHRPAWSPDGRRVTVGVEQGGRWQLLDLPLGGAGRPVTVLESQHRVYPNAWTPDGRSLLFEELRAETGWDLRAVEAGRDGRAAGAARDLSATPFQERKAAISPDGRLVAFESNELDGVNGVFVAPLGQPGAKVRAAPTFANWPRWGRDGRLYYWYPAQARAGDSADPEGVYAAEWAGQPPAPPAPARRVPVVTSGPGGAGVVDRLLVAPFAGFDVDGAGETLRVLALETSAGKDAPPISSPVLCLDLAEELRRPRAAPWAR